MSKKPCWCSPLYLKNYKILYSKCFHHNHLQESAKSSKSKVLSSYFNFSNSVASSKNTCINSWSISKCERHLRRQIWVANHNLNGKRLFSSASKSLHEELSRSDEPRKENWTANTNSVNEYTLRSHSCGELRPCDIGKRVKLMGWVEYIRMNKFILLRDYYGTTQIIVPENHPSLSQLNIESIICVDGEVQARPVTQISKKLDTGEIEVNAVSIEIINNAIHNLPFHIRELHKANSQVLNRYRYLALRFRDLQNNLRLRSEMFLKMREFLIREKKFVEVETPTLFKKTPGGAQEFIVPTHEKNKFYSLVQSPQQLKQLLMVGSVDRYFQVARCYRDEKTTGERQPEFTQLDIELSFTNVDGVIKLTEDLLAASWPKSKASIRTPFPRMHFQHAMENYGSDKPCLLDKFLVQNLKPYIHEDAKNYSFMFIIPNGQFLYRKLREHFDLLDRKDFTKIHVMKISTVEKLCNDFVKIFGNFMAEEFQNNISVKKEDLIILCKGPHKMNTLETLGVCRHYVIDELQLIDQMNKNGIYDFLRVIDFPLLEKKDDELKSAHHPFTQPHPKDMNLLSINPLKVRSLAYDLVLNGSEIGGGSIRIHDVKLQEEIFEILNLNKEDFSHMLEALKMGCPPHGGIALGMDRLIAILCNRKTIKDVIAFPKGQAGQDFMTDCPSDVPLTDKIRYHIPFSRDN